MSQNRSRGHRTPRPSERAQDTGTWEDAVLPSTRLLEAHCPLPGPSAGDEAEAERQSLAALLVAYACVPPTPAENADAKDASRTANRRQGRKPEGHRTPSDRNPT